MPWSFKNYLNQYTETAPLAVFRIFFGLMMLISIVRFWAKGWIEKLYIQPKFFFSYYGFEFVKPFGEATYLVFVICGLAALAIAIGWYYRIASVMFFLSFTYIELMDKTTYLNHYYFVSLVSFLLIFLPANAYFSADAQRKKRFFTHIPKWNIDVIKFLIAIVYFYAGLAKLNSDWLFNAMPLKIWLPSKFDLPFLGDLLQQTWVHYAFSYFGVIYDLLIPFLLLYKPTRWFAFMIVIIFHVLTRVLFPIGMFPYIMIVNAFIFFDASFHHKVIGFISKTLRIKVSDSLKNQKWIPSARRKTVLVTLFVLFFCIQLLVPFRHMLYPGELFWTEQGYRFSWRVMLMEKAGYANFKIVNNKNGQTFYINNDDFLSSFQQKQMSVQPDFILEYAHFLKSHFQSQGHQDISIYVDSYVTLNGRLSERYIDPSVDLSKIKESFDHKSWIIPFKDEIKGF